MARLPTDRQIRREIEEKLTVPLWPVAGRALGLARTATYAAAQSGEIKTVDVSAKRSVSTAWLKEKLNLKSA
jgi:hypothetical protein